MGNVYLKKKNGAIPPGDLWSAVTAIITCLFSTLLAALFLGFIRCPRTYYLYFNIGNFVLIALKTKLTPRISKEICF